MTFDICIVGGGFSGLMTLYHLVMQAASPLRIGVIEPRARLGAGAAYSTPHAHHILNVPAGNMSALPDAPAHFAEWLATPEAAAGMRKIGIAPRSYAAGDFVPRALYACYLDSLCAAALAAAKENGCEVAHLRHTAQSMTRDAAGLMHLAVEQGQTLVCRRLLLAMGNLPPAPHEDPRIVTDVFAYDYAQLAEVPDGVAIVGTGLTMVDTLLSLRAGGYRGPVTAVSRRGHMPHVHDGISLQGEGRGKALSAAPQSLLTLMRAFRADVRASLAACGSWQPVFNHWRPYFPVLWQGLSLRDRRVFLRRLFSLWNIHRHRMAKEIGDVVSRDRDAGLLRVFQGNAALVSTADAVQVSSAAGPIAARVVFDCRGPGYDLVRGGYPLLRQMFDAGTIAPHAAGFGLAADGWRALDAAGRPQDDIFAIGTLLVGARLETTAVPELRAQAGQLATVLLDSLAHGEASKAAVARG